MFINNLVLYPTSSHFVTFRRSWAAVATTNNRGGRTNYAAWKKKVTFSGGDIQYYYCVLLCSCLRVHISSMYWTWDQNDIVFWAFSIILRGLNVGKTEVENGSSGGVSSMPSLVWWSYLSDLGHIGLKSLKVLFELELVAFLYVSYTNCTLVEVRKYSL